MVSLFIDKKEVTIIVKGDTIIYSIGKEKGFRGEVVSSNFFGNTCQLKVRVLGTPTITDITLPVERGEIIFPSNIAGIER